MHDIFQAELDLIRLHEHETFENGKRQERLKVHRVLLWLRSVVAVCRPQRFEIIPFGEIETFSISNHAQDEISSSQYLDEACMLEAKQIRE